LWQISHPLTELPVSHEFESFFCAQRRGVCGVLKAKKGIKREREGGEREAERERDQREKERERRR
jgi:hypothetical protein